MVAAVLPETIQLIIVFSLQIIKIHNLSALLPQLVTQSNTRQSDHLAMVLSWSEIFASCWDYFCLDIFGHGSILWQLLERLTQVCESTLTFNTNQTISYLYYINPLFIAT